MEEDFKNRMFLHREGQGCPRAMQTGCFYVAKDRDVRERLTAENAENTEKDRMRMK